MFVRRNSPPPIRNADKQRGVGIHLCRQEKLAGFPWTLDFLETGAQLPYDFAGARVIEHNVTEHLANFIKIRVVLGQQQKRCVSI